MSMLVKLDLPEFRQLPAVVALGVFDGVHNGHRQIIRKLGELSSEPGIVRIAVTFHPHPRAVLGTPPELLMDLEERIETLHSAGVDAVGVIKFDSSLSVAMPEDFLTQLIGELNVKGMCVGQNWRFGRRGAGDAGVVANFAAAHGINFLPCPELEQDGRVISSSWIRELISNGNLAKAVELSGRYPQISGSVAHGNKVAGQLLLAPTANIEYSSGIIPPNGVYAAWAKLENKTTAMAAVNIGVAPTFAVGVRRIEAHLLDYSENIYGQKIKLSLVTKIRDERSFNSPEELRTQIGLDISNIRSILLK